MLRKFKIFFVSFFLFFPLFGITANAQSSNMEISPRTSYTSTQVKTSSFYFDGKNYELTSTYKVTMDASSGRIIAVDLLETSSTLPSGKWVLCELISAYPINNYKWGLTLDVYIKTFVGKGGYTQVHVEINSTGPIWLNKTLSINVRQITA